MDVRWLQRVRTHPGIGYVAIAGLSLLLLVGLLRLWRADWTVPFTYKGDALLNLLWIKTVAETGWYLDNPRVGLPTGLALADWPMADGLHFLLLKALTGLTDQCGLVFNLFFVLTFPLTACAGYGTLRGLGIGRGSALVAGLLFTFLPYHFVRGAEGHLFLASYFMVPLACLVALQLMESARSRAGNSLLSHFGICVLLSATGIYYAVFGSFLFLVAGIAAGIQQRSPRPLLAACGRTAIVGAGLLAHGLPTLSYAWTQGFNAAALDRPLSNVETYGLKIANLLLPTSVHRVPWLAHFKHI